MTRMLTNSDDTTSSERGGLGRRTLLKGAATARGRYMHAAAASRRSADGPDPRLRRPWGRAAALSRLLTSIAIEPKRFKAKVGNRHHGDQAALYRLPVGGRTGVECAAGNICWSDIPNNRQLRYLDDDGHISERLRKPSNEANGNTFDTEGRQLSAERTRLVRYEHRRLGDDTGRAGQWQAAQRAERHGRASQRQGDLVHRSRLRRDQHL